MANLLRLQLYSASVRRRYCTLNREIDLWRSFLSRGSVQCRASRGGRFRFRAEDELFRDGGFEFGYRKKKRPWWWLDDDDDDDDLMNDDEDWSMVFEVFRTLSWMLAPIGISLLLGTESDAGLMALAVPLVQSLLSLVFSKVLSRTSVVRPIERSRIRGKFSRTRKAKNMGGDGGGSVDKEGYKSWMVGDAGDYNSAGSVYGGWDDLDKRNEIPSEENVRSKQQFKRGNATRRWRVKEKPLLLRMLFAAFPFLSSWTRLLF